jgi:hypothetical protein
MNKSLTILTAILFSSVVHAEFKAYTENKNGGKIIVTNEECTLKKIPKEYREAMYSAVAYSDKINELLIDCWQIYKKDNDYIVIIWEDDYKLKIYPMHAFTIEKPKGQI